MHAKTITLSTDCTICSANACTRSAYYHILRPKLSAASRLMIAIQQLSCAADAGSSIATSERVVRLSNCWQRMVCDRTSMHSN